MRTAMLVIALVAAVGCFPGPLAVPEGGQEVKAIVEGDRIRLEPSVVRAGEVYLVLDTGVNVILVQSAPSAESTPGPLSDAQIERIRHGDTFHTSITAGFANGEPYGNVSKLMLQPGKHLFLLAEPTDAASLPGGVIPPESMGILVVQP